MVGTKKIKLLIGIFIPFFAFFSMSQNNFAASISNLLNNQAIYKTTFGGANQVRNVSGSVPLMLVSGKYSTNYFSLISNAFSTNSPIGAQNGISYIIDVSYNLSFDGIEVPSELSQNPSHLKGSARFEQGVISSENQSVQILAISPKSLRVKHHAEVSLASSTRLSSIAVYLNSSAGSLASCDSTIGSMNVFCSSSGQHAQISNIQMTAVVSEDPSLVLLQEQINQNQTIINQNQQQIDQDNAAYDSISGQTPEDIDGSSDGQTTSLINVISGFIAGFSNINATDCNLTLEFPDYVGGSKEVDICSGKEQAPRIVEIGSSLLLICVFVPLAWILMNMIYNEIRSWTNG